MQLYSVRGHVWILIIWTLINVIKLSIPLKYPRSGTLYSWNPDIWRYWEIFSNEFPCIMVRCGKSVFPCMVTIVAPLKSTTWIFSGLSPNQSNLQSLTNQLFFCRQLCRQKRRGRRGRRGRLLECGQTKQRLYYPNGHSKRYCWCYYIVLSISLVESEQVFSFSLFASSIPHWQI